MKKFFLKSLGCKTNQLEGQIIAQNLKNNGFSEVTKIEEANFYILNSCTVTQSADSQVVYLLNKAKRENPNIKTVLAGCIVQAGTVADADFLLDNKQKLEIAKILNGVSINPNEHFAFLEKPTSTRVSVKIQEGCDNACSYCIIPKARGASISNSIENIIEQIEQIVKLGHKEIVLTGIHIGKWGLEKGSRLLDLLQEIDKTKIHRWRLGSLYINEISNEMIKFLRKSEKFCPHFHLSLQSMCDKTLKGMNRNYSVDEALKLIEKLHENFDLPFLGSDIIVGFPGETDEDFKETLKNISSAKLSKIHVFPYSRRKDTAADKMDGQVKEEIKKARARELIKLSDMLYNKFLKANLGRELEVIYENKPSKSALNKGISRNYIEIRINGEENLRGKIENIILSKDMLRG